MFDLDKRKREVVKSIESVNLSFEKSATSAEKELRFCKEMYTMFSKDLSNIRNKIAIKKLFS